VDIVVRRPTVVRAVDSIRARRPGSARSVRKAATTSADDGGGVVGDALGAGEGVGDGDGAGDEDLAAVDDGATVGGPAVGPTSPQAAASMAARATMTTRAWGGGAARFRGIDSPPARDGRTDRTVAA
jgi:hypothetical protein